MLWKDFSLSLHFLLDKKLLFLNYVLFPFLGSIRKSWNFWFTVAIKVNKTVLEFKSLPQLSFQLIWLSLKLNSDILSLSWALLLDSFHCLKVTGIIYKALYMLCCFLVLRSEYLLHFFTAFSLNSQLHREQEVRKRLHSHTNMVGVINFKLWL